MLEHSHHAGLWRYFQRRSALVARELARLDIDIAALREVCFAEQGSLREDGAGYTLVVL